MMTIIHRDDEDGDDDYDHDLDDDDADNGDYDDHDALIAVIMLTMMINCLPNRQF